MLQDDDEEVQSSDPEVVTRKTAKYTPRVS